MKIKEKIKELFKSDYKGIAILFILQTILIITIKPIRFDDAFYIEKFTTQSLFSFLQYRYMNWTSRFLIEATLGIIFKVSGYIWTIGNIALITLLGYSILRIFVKKELRKEMSMMVLWIVILYPIDRMATAGWAATTVNYMWPLSAGLFSLIAIKRIWDKEKINPFLAVLFMGALIYGCNQEQTCVVLLVTYILFTIILTIRDKKKVNLFMYVQTIIAILSMIFILTTPGNEARRTNEIIGYFPEYYTLGIIDKLSMGITSTVLELIINYSITFAVFTFVMLVYIWDNYKDKLVRGIAVIPFASTLIFSYLTSFTEHMSLAVKLIRDRYINQEFLIKPSKYTYLGNYVELILSLIIIFSIFACLLLIFKKLKNNIAFYVFGCGLATRLIMAFTPTIFISTNRTFIFMEFACLICTLLIWQEFIKKADKKYKTKIYNIVVLASAIQYIFSLGFVFMSHINV